MVHVKSILGIALVVFAFHFMKRRVPSAHALRGSLAGVLLDLGGLVIVGACSGAVHRGFGEPGTGCEGAPRAWASC